MIFLPKLSSPGADRIYIVGLPNTGKSWVFNYLTGSYSIVANYPFTTVDLIRTPRTIQGKRYEVIDSPGCHSLHIHSEEEMITRNAIFEQPPTLIIQCIDALRVKQSLKLTVELALLDVPMIIVLTAVDDARRAGVIIDAKQLSQTLGVPVIVARNLEDRGLKGLRRAPNIARIPTLSIDYGPEIGNAMKQLLQHCPPKIPFRQALILLLLENDQTLHTLLSKILTTEETEELVAATESIRKAMGKAPERVIAAESNRWVTTISDRVIKRFQPPHVRKSEIVARICRGAWSGPIVLAFLMALMYLAVAHGGSAIEHLLTNKIVTPVVTYLQPRISPPWLNSLLIGEYGVLTMGVFNALCTVLPILGIFFLLFGVLEDSGYIANLCVMTYRLAGFIGITGKSIMPIMLGFSCKTMATLLARCLQSRREKFIVIFLIAFAMPCSPQLGMIMAILGKTGFHAFLIAVGMLAFFELLAGLMLNRILPPDVSSEFIQELPPMRLPSARAVLAKTYHRLAVFLIEALPIFIVAAAALHFIDLSGILSQLEIIFSPLIGGWLGLPNSITKALLLTMARHEAGASILLRMVNEGSLDFIQTIIAVVLVTMFVPCFANMVAIFRETGVRTGIVIIVIINVVSFFLAGLLRFILQTVVL